MTMQFRIGPGLVLVLGLAAGVQTASAALRCGTEVVLEGDSKQTLLETCGEPDEGSPAMHTDVWVYRIDEEEYSVHIVNGTVERIDTPEMSKEAPPPEPAEQPPNA